VAGYRMNEEQKELELNEAERIPEETLKRLWKRIFDKISYPTEWSIIAYVLKPIEYEKACKQHNVTNANAFVVYDKKNKKYLIFLQQGHEGLTLVHELVHIYNYELFGDGVEELEERKGGM
jgi:hypothetical protein